MKERLVKLEELVRQHSEEISQLFRIESKQNGEYMKDQLEHQKFTDGMKSVHEKLDILIKQTTKTNGTVRLHTKILLVFGTAVGVLLVTNGSSLVKFLELIIR
jgi:hypothetical protein